ncbi:MAG TPA: 1,4-alpha-glucan branching protein [Planctomycetes bacterium]|nr:1,4-alpha-glucan branching protein [Planctomycetota bacterium]
MGPEIFGDATAGNNGTSFRVWAPHASTVHLAGPFNNWSASASPLAPEGGGNWSLDVRNLGHGEPFRYMLGTAQGTLWKQDPRARAVTDSAGDSLVVDPNLFDWSGPPFSTPAWDEMVIYEMHVGTFNAPWGVGSGKFDTVLPKLDYLADLGINVIQLMPVCEFPGNRSWGYNYSAPFAVEESYGGLEGLKNLVKEAHARGIAVVLDVLYNHWGPIEMDLWKFDGWSENGFGGIYFYNDARAVTMWGDTRPDYRQGPVRQYIRDNAMMWLEENWIDGLRWDSTVNIRSLDNGFGAELPEGWSLMQWINDEIDASQGWKISIAEDMWVNDWITKPTGAGGAGFDSQWDSVFVHPVRGNLIAAADASRDMWAIKQSIEKRYNSQAMQRVIFTESHDEVANGSMRLPEEIWPGNADSWYSKKRSTLGAALVMTSPGIPMLFQGQEFLEDGWFSDTDPLDWSKLNLFPGIRDLYRDLIRLRRNLDGVSAGLRGNERNVYHVNNNDKVLAFHRWDQGGSGDDVVVVANFSNTAWPSYTIGLPRDGTWKVRLNSDWQGYDPSFGNHPSNDIPAQSGGRDGLPYRGDISIGPYTAIVLSQ